MEKNSKVVYFWFFFEENNSKNPIESCNSRGCQARVHFNLYMDKHREKKHLLERDWSCVSSQSSKKFSPATQVDLLALPITNPSGFDWVVSRSKRQPSCKPPTTCTKGTSAGKGKTYSNPWRSVLYPAPQMGRARSWRAAPGPLVDSSLFCRLRERLSHGEEVCSDRVHSRTETLEVKNAAPPFPHSTHPHPTPSPRVDRVAGALFVKPEMWDKL